MRCGFHIGLRSRCNAGPSIGTPLSTHVQAAAVDRFIAQQHTSGHMIGSLSLQDCHSIITSSMEAIFKTFGQWRVLVDLSSPAGASINNNLCQELTHVAHSSMEDAAMMIHSLGEGTLLAKIDIKDAYHIVPIHPHDLLYLGNQWKDHAFMDTQLPFGLASAQATFSAPAEALEWILRQHSACHILHYLDDFLIMRPPGTVECVQTLSTVLALCAELGVPLAPEKMEGLATSLVFLGAELSSHPRGSPSSRPSWST